MAINFRSLYLEELNFYRFKTLQERLHYDELDFCEFSVHFVIPSLKYLIDKYLILARSECCLITSNNSRGNYQFFKFFPAGIRKPHAEKICFENRSV